MKESKYEYETRQKMGLPNACERISKMKLETSFGTDMNEQPQTWWVSITYPNEARVITQSKEVDIHALIGNIGGYLGLFMGRYPWCFSKLLLCPEIKMIIINVLYNK